MEYKSPRAFWESGLVFFTSKTINPQNDWDGRLWTRDSGLETPFSNPIGRPQQDSECIRVEAGQQQHRPITPQLNRTETQDGPHLR